jgi:excisionase family DNA binding protein
MPKSKAPAPAVAPRAFTLAESIFTIAEAAVQTRLSRATIYREIGANKLKTVKVGSRRLIRGVDLVAYLNALTDAA